jgi:hypothetical protein
MKAGLAPKRFAQGCRATVRTNYGLQHDFFGIPPS